MAMANEVKTLLPGIQNALSEHQFSCLKLAFHSLGVAMDVVETPHIQLTGLYDTFSFHSPQHAPVLLYKMLLQVIRPDDADKLKCTECLKPFVNTADNVELELGAALVLKAGSILESLKPDTFIVMKKYIRDKKFPKYDLDHLSTPTKLIRLLVERNILKKELLYQALAVCTEPCEQYIDEIKSLCGDADISQDLIQMNKYERPKTTCKPSRKTIFIGSTCGCVSFCLLTVIMVFVTFLFYPLTSEATYLLYAPPNGATSNSMIECYNSLTKGIAAEIVASYPFESRDMVTVVAYEIEENDLQTYMYNVHLEEKRLVLFSHKYGINKVQGLNYYQDDNPFYTASDGTIVFKIQLNASSNIDCPFRITGFTSYNEYWKFIHHREYSQYTSYVETKCFAGTNNLENYTVPFDLEGNKYYFFAVMYTDSDFGVIASVNTSQYLVSEYLSNCTLNYDDRCSFPTVDLSSALSINRDSKCLVVSASRHYGDNFNATMQTSVQSHVRSVISGIVMMVTFIVCLVALVVVVGICICRYHRYKTAR